MPEVNNWNQQIIAQFHTLGGKNVPGFGDNLLLLNTKGAKSGQVRVNPLAYSKDGDRYVIIASKAGAPKNPDWYHNLVKNPVTTINVGTDTIKVRATEAKGADRDRLFAAHGALMPGFLEYERKTTRKIPAIWLDKVAD